MHDILKKKPCSPDSDIKNIPNVLKVSHKEMLDEWRFLQRLDGDLLPPDKAITLATSPQNEKMYPTISAAIRRLLLLSVGTATVERSFSILNRISSSEKCRFRARHVNGGTPFRLAFSQPECRSGCFA